MPRGSNGGIGARGYGKLSLYAGGGLFVIAGGLGLWAWHSYRAQFPSHCMESPIGGPPLCDSAGRLDRARLFGDLANVAAGVGTVALITGAIVLWRYPSAERRAVVIASPNSVGVALGGEF